jgi:hypothetical protein
MDCNSASGGKTMIWVESQIVTSPGAVPLAKGAGGLNHIARLEDIEDTDTIQPWTTFNLSSTRSIYFASAGRKSVYFKMRKGRMDSVTSCHVYNASFSVVVTP